MTRILPFSFKKQEVERNTSTKTSTHRRSYNSLRLALIEALQKFPSSTYNLAKLTKMDLRTAYKHLLHLKRLNRVEQFTMKFGSRKANYWRLK